jgi:hypothetical protein
MDGAKRATITYPVEGHMTLRRKSWIRIAGVVALTLPSLMTTRLGNSVRGSRGTAIAQPGPPQGPTVQCTMRGQSVMSDSVSIVDARGRSIARFSGATTPLVASDFPSNAQGRVRIETGFGAGSFRLRGFVDAGQLPIFTAVSVAVTPGHVWIASNRSVTLLGAASGRLSVEKKLNIPLKQTFHAAGECSAFSLEAGTSAGFSPPGDARSYELKRESLDLYSDPGADAPVTTLHRSPAVEAVSFFGGEQRGGFIHIEYHGEIVIDGWAKMSALSALPVGEITDQLAPATVQHGVPRIALPAQPKLVRPSRDVPLRSVAKESEPMIGVVEPGTETYVLDQVAGWANVLPKSMNVLPRADGQFWAKSSDLGL